MCGIAGYINFKKETISNVVLKNMVKTLSHRGQMIMVFIMMGFVV